MLASNLLKSGFVHDQNILLYHRFFRYLEDPVLFNRPGVGQVKFDIRYIILLRSVSPLKVTNTSVK